MVSAFRTRFWICLILTVPVLLLSPGGGHAIGPIGAFAFPGSQWLLLALGSVVYFYGGWPFLSGLAGELVKRQPGMMTLIDIMLLGHWIEMKSVLGASGALRALVELLPKTAHRLGADGALVDVPIESLQPGDKVLVKPGERVPTDGVIVQGTTSVDESMLTGESKPVPRVPGERLIGGAINAEGAVNVQVDRTGAQTYLAQVIDMVSKAQASCSRVQSHGSMDNRSVSSAPVICSSIALRSMILA
jgi:Cu2+-exporting ATPase